MKKLLASAALAGASLIAGPAAAIDWDYCLDIQCDACTSMTPQQLRMNINWSNRAFQGIVQATDGSWGHPANGKIVDQKVIFARYNRTDSKQYLYIIDMGTLSGTRMQTSYRRYTDDTSGEQVVSVPFEAGSAVDTSLTLGTCPSGSGTDGTDTTTY